MNARFLVIALSVLLFIGCAVNDPKTGESKTSNAAKGAGGGALAGAAVGAAMSHNNRGKGAAIGAVLGGGVGAVIGYHKDKQEPELREQFKSSNVDVQREGDAIRIVLPGSVSFDTGSAKLRPTFYASLDKVAASLNQYPTTKILIGGHTDNKGSEATNRKLSLDRANAVASYLVSQGIDSSRLKTAGFGSQFPIADNGNNMGRSQNRRVEVKIIAETPATAADQ